MPHNYDKEFKINAVQYYEDHKDLGLVGCVSNLGISKASLSNWRKEHANTGDIEVIRSGNYSSDYEKEIAQLC